MSTETALLRAIRDMPDEDTPRLIYADFLDEEGYSPRAEFIRVQIERAQLPEHDPRRAPLEDREHELLGEYECAWLGVEPDQVNELAGWVFERGFVNEVAAPPSFMNGPGTDLCAAHPVRRWRVTSGRGTDFPEDLREAGQRPWCSRLETLDLSGWYATLGELSGFLGSRSNFALLRELNLTHREPLGTLPEIIEFAPFRDQLKSLRCGHVGYEGGRLDVPEFLRALGTNCRLETFAAPVSLLMTDDVRDLLASDAMASLVSLDLHANQIEADGWGVFRGAKFRLHELNISDTPLGGSALDRLLGCASLSELRTLHLDHCQCTAASVRALAASRFWTQAEELRIQQGTIWNDGIEHDEPTAPASLNPLFAARGPSHLRVLDISGNNWRDAGVAKLCNAEWAGSLVYLDLSQNCLTDEALRCIAKSGRFANLRTLNLNLNSLYHLDGAVPDESITEAGLRVLANCPDLANLRTLSVSHTHTTAAGVDAVLNGPHWRLTGLQLAHCQLRPNVIEVIASSPRLARLESLDLSQNYEIDMDDLEPLAESEYLSPQTKLDIRGINGGGKIRTALRQRLGFRLTER